MRNNSTSGGRQRSVMTVAVCLIVLATLSSALAGCSTPPPTMLHVVRSLGARDSGSIDRPLAAAATRQGAMLLSRRADDEAEIIELDANGAPTAFHRLAASLDSSPHDFGLLPDGRLAVHTKADKVQLFARDASGVYAVTSALPAGGPLAVAPDGSLYIAFDATIRRYSADGGLQSSWSVPGKPSALAWDATLKHVCALVPTSGPEQLRITERSAVYSEPNYGSERLGALDRGVVVTVEDGIAPVGGFVRVSAPFAGFVPVGCVASIIGTLCQYTPDGGAGSLLTVTCDYAPACTATRSPLSVAVSPDGVAFILLRERVTAGDRLSLVVVGESGFGYIRSGTLPTAPPGRRPQRGSIADVQAAGLACTGRDILVVDGFQVWQAPIRGGAMSVIRPNSPAEGTFREPLAITIDSDSDDVTVLDWLRGDLQTWDGTSVSTVTPAPLNADESAIDVLTGRDGVHWLAVASAKSARVTSPGQPTDYPVPAILAESLNLSAWWLEADSDAGPPLVIAGWSGRILSNVNGVWVADAGGYTYPWEYYLPDCGADVAVCLRRAGLLPKTGGTPPDWTQLIRGLSRGPDGRVYVVTGRVSTYGVRIFVFSSDGQVTAQYRLPPEVGLPSDIAVDRDEHIWLTDPENYRVVELATGDDGD